MSYITISKLENFHSEVLRGLLFYKEEISILEGRLEEVAAKNNSFEARQGIEHFQNQFILQRNSIDELKHKVNLFADHLASDAKQHTGHIEKKRVEEQDALKDEYILLEKVIKEMRREFNTFLSKWM